MLPLENFKIGLSKMRFPAFAGPELINWEGLLRHQECTKTMKCYFVFAIYYYNINQFAFWFLVDFKMNSNQKEYMKPRRQMVYRRTLHVKQPYIAFGIWPETKALEV